jgi:hypothetical protein
VTSPSQPPPSSKIPGKSSGSGLYLIGIVVLAVGAVGLFFWKKDSTIVVEQPPPATAPSASVTAAEALPQLYAPPPPPKIEEEPDASAKVSTGSAGTKGTGVAMPAPGPCGNRCDGSATPALQSALRGTAQSAQGCYNRALRNSEASGRLLVSVQLASNGSVCNASLAEDSVHSGEIASCVLGRFRGHTFPAPQGGCTTVNIPISFAIKQ